MLRRFFHLSFSAHTTVDPSSVDPSSGPTLAEPESPRSPQAGLSSPNLAAGKMQFWEPHVVFLVTLAVLALFTQRIVAYLTPVTGDEPFYLMTDISILKDGDLNECNNYIQLDDAQLYPSFYSFDGVHAYAAFPPGWLGWRGAPYPLPPHATHLVPASRQCSSDYLTYPIDYNNPAGELYSKHGLGLSLLVLPAFALGGRLTVVFFLNILGALLAVNIYLFAREGTGKLLPAVLTWVAFAFTVPLMPYSYLIFPELPAALLIIYAFRRIRLMHNNPAQTLLIGLCVASLPWLHYRFVPVCAALVLYYFFQDRAAKEKRRVRNWVLLAAPVALSAVAMMLFFYQRYRIPLPNAEDHAGISDVAGTIRGAVGMFLDQQWGLFVAAPIFILAIVGIVLMSQDRARRQDMLWIGVVSVPYLLVIANYAQWWGEWCPPARYLAPVLPLFSLPFSFALGNIRNVAYKAVYGVLLLLSLVTMWGFLFQPQWMYNQPDGKSILFVNGLSGVLNSLHITFINSNDVVGFFPSFVVPYFAYFQSRAAGDAAAAAAWRASIWPVAIVFAVVLLCLLLAHFSKRGGDAITPGQSPSTDDSSSDSDATGRDLSTQATSPVSFRMRIAPAQRLRHALHALGAQLAGLAALMMPGPHLALSWAGASPVSGGLRFQATGHDSQSTGESAPSANGSEQSNEMSPWVPKSPDGDGSAANGKRDTSPGQKPEQPGASAGTPHVDGAAGKLAGPQPETAEKPTPSRSKPASFVRIIWRTRGLWFGLIAVGIAMYAQKLTTVDRKILDSIHWYALAIAVMLVGWLGTYTNRSFLVVPIRQLRKKEQSSPSGETATGDALDPAGQQPAAAQTLNEPERNGSASELTPALNGSAGDSVLSSALPSVAPLPTRKRRAVPGEACTSQSVEAPVAEAVETNGASLGNALVTRPVRSRTHDAQQGGSGNGFDLPNGHVATGSPPNGSQDISGTAAVAEPVATPEASPAQGTGQPRRRNPVVRLWKRVDERFPGFGSTWWRYVLAFIALGVNIYAVQLIRHDYYSVIGSWAWVASLALLLVAFLGERRRKVRDLDAHTDIMEQTDTRLSRKAEVAIILIIFVLGLSLRLLNLGDMTTGMHGDEGEAGMDAINILEGNRVSPFLTGWFLQPNFYYWGIALTMKIFGTDLFGLRMFSAICGSLMILPFYGLARLWFGVRTAIIAALLLALSDVAIHFSKAEFSNITTPLFLTTGFFFLFKGLVSKRTIYFVLSGYGFMMSLYFYMGGRLTPFMVIAVIGYMFLLMPIVRIPGSYFAIRKLTPQFGRLRALGRAGAEQARSVVHYFGQLLVLAIACFCLASPWLVYYQDNQSGANSRTNDKLIFDNADRMASQYQVTHGPLYVGIRMPTGDDVYPFLPVVFEKTPLSVQVASDGFWPKVMWDQLTTTLSVFTYRFDASSVYTFTNEPVSKPIEAALLILGLAWALWRWRDARMGVISIWFWSTILVGGMLTIDAPYMARIVGVIPLMALLVAIPVSKLAAEFLRLMSIIAVKIRAVRPRRVFAVSSRAFSASVVGALLLYLAFQNYGDYFLRYIKSYSFPEVTGQSYFVRQMNAQETSQGRPIPYYYDLGIHFIYWGHGDNRFLNHGTPGADMVNPSDDLPILNNDNRDVVFMVWSLNASYMDVLKTYYPNGHEESFLYGPAGTGALLFNYYVVPKEQIDARRHSLASYQPASGPAVERNETSLGSGSTPPAGLSYPVQATWTGNLVAPAFGRYQFSLDNAGAGSMKIDGRQVLTTTTSAGHSEGEVLLARGPHDVTLTGSMADASSQVNLQWDVNGQGFAPIPSTYLWDGPGRGLLGQIRTYSPDLLKPAAQGGVFNTRIDGFLGFRDAPNSLQGGGGLTGIWTGTIDIKNAGTYSFDTNSNGDSVVLIDNQLVVNNIRGGTDPHQSSGQVDLTPGPHTYELRYNWSGGTGYLEAYWTPPGGPHTLLGPDVLHTTGGVVDSSQVASEPPPVQIAPEAPPSVLQPQGTINGDFMKARGLAVDKQGNIFVGDRGNHRIIEYTPDGKVARMWGTAAPEADASQAGPTTTPAGGQFNDILDVAVGDDGTVYVLDSTPRLQAFSSTGQFLGSIEPSQLAVYAPNGISSAAGGANSGQRNPGVIIAVTGQDRLLGLPSIQALQGGQATLPASAESITVSDGDNLEQPVDVIADPSGNGVLYAIDLKDRVVQLTPKGSNGQRAWTITKQWRVPVGRDDGGSRLAISPDGKFVYMSDPDRQRVAVVNVSTAKVTYFGSAGQGGGQFGAPSGIAVGPDGKVYVLDRLNNNVQIFDLGKQ